MSVRRGLCLGAMALCALQLSACASMPRAWQRGDLAKAEMAWDPDPYLSAIRAHTYDSKEAASGQASAAGGGCGCN